MIDELTKMQKAALALARLGANMRRAAARSRRRTQGCFDAMLAELESNAETLDGFADTLEAVCDEFELNVTEKGRETSSNVEYGATASPEEGSETGEVRQTGAASHE